MRLLIVLMGIAVLFMACAGSTVPDDIIPVQKMETIIWQLMQSDEYVNGILSRDSTKKGSTERMKKYQQVFDLNKISMSEFKKSYRFYMAHPDITKIMFDSIIARAGRQRIEIYKPKPDSVSKAGMQHVKPGNQLPDTAAAKITRIPVKRFKPKTDSAVKQFRKP